MTLLYHDSFDAGDYAQRYTVAGSVSSSTSNRGFGGRSLSMSGSGVSVRRAVAASARLIAGFAFNPSVAPSTNADMLRFYGDNGTTQHATVVYTTAAGFNVTRGGTVIASSASSAANPNTWNYLEVSSTVDDSTGRLILRVNGTIVIDFTGDTRNAGTSTNLDNLMLLGATGLAGNVLYDDLYIANALGSTPNNDFLGDVRAVSLAPTGAGTTTQLTPSTGSNWDCVNELPFSATDFVSGSIVGNKDTYATADLTGSPTVYGVQVVAIAKKTDAGTRNLKTVVRAGGTDYSDSTAQALTTSDATYVSMRETNPNTGVAWTAANVNAMEIGVEVA